MRYRVDGRHGQKPCGGIQTVIILSTMIASYVALESSTISLPISTVTMSYLFKYGISKLERESLILLHLTMNVT